MTARVITIAMSDGAGAEEIGRSVAHRLHFRYINEDVIARAAQKARVSPDDINKVEHTRPLAERIAKALSTVVERNPEAEVLATALYGVYPADTWLAASLGAKPDSEVLYRNLIREVLWEIGREGQAVIVAHGASIELARTAGVLRVFITGSLDVRAEHLAATEHTDRNKTQKRVAHGDRERADYLKRFYDIKQELPTHYDLVVNNDTLPAAVAVEAIVSAANSIA